MEETTTNETTKSWPGKKRGRKPKAKNSSSANATKSPTAKKRGRPAGKKNNQSKTYTGKKRGRKPGWKAPSSIPSGISFTVTGGVLIMNSIPNNVNSMVFVRGNKLTTVEI